MAISGPRLRNHHAHIVDALGRDIVSGTLASGSTLPGDAELMDRFGVSRTVLREALKTLAAKGLIVARARIGTRVTARAAWNLFDADILGWHFETGIDERFLVDISEVRLAFEPYAAALAAARATDAEIEALQGMAGRMGQGPHSAESYALADLAFHLAVLQAARNPFMRSVGNLIEAALVGVFRLNSPATDPALMAQTAATHSRIVEAIRSRDSDRARRAMEEVILSGVDRVRDALDARTA